MLGEGLLQVRSDVYYKVDVAQIDSTPQTAGEAPAPSALAKYAVVLDGVIDKIINWDGFSENEDLNPDAVIIRMPENDGVKYLNDFGDIVLDATGNKKAMQQQLNYLGHGGKWILIGLHKEELNISHPDFHKREATLMSSRNATKEDFQKVLNKINNKKIDASILMSHTLFFEEVMDHFLETIKDPNLIKGIIKVNELEK
jgi:threonine dehydrogenase-like Zn-dependent dehydrogenase